MRVLQVIPQMESSAGAETSLRAVDPLLVQAGFEIHLAVLTEHQNLVSDLVSTGVEFHDLSGSSGAGQLRSLAQLIRRLRPDLVHASLLQAALPNQLICPLLRVPVLVTWANTSTAPEGEVSPWKHAVVRAADTAAAALSRSRFHAVTQGVADSKRAELHVGAKRVKVAERGRDPDRYRPCDDKQRLKMRAALGISDPDDFVLLAVGRQEPQKDYPLLISAFDSAATTRPSLRLLIAGRKGSGTRDIESALRRARHGDRVELLGQRDDVPELLGAADAVVCSSRREGAAGSLIEAMATGIPILSVELDGLVGVLDNEVNSLVVAREELASGIIRMADDEELRRRLADAAQSTFLQRFTVERSAEALAEVYRWAVGR